MKKAARKVSVITAVSRPGASSRTSGIQARIGIGRATSSSGNTTARNHRLQPDSTPTRMPRLTATQKAMATRLMLENRCL